MSDKWRKYVKIGSVCVGILVIIIGTNTITNYFAEGRIEELRVGSEARLRDIEDTNNRLRELDRRAAELDRQFVIRTREITRKLRDGIGEVGDTIGRIELAIDAIEQIIEALPEQESYEK